MTMKKTQNQMNRPSYKRRNERGNWEYKKTGNGRIEMPGDFSVIVNPYLWKCLKNVHDEFFKMCKFYNMSYLL